MINVFHEQGFFIINVSLLCPISATKYVSFPMQIEKKTPTQPGLFKKLTNLSR